jgi:PAS domain S-box-containing protein
MSTKHSLQARQKALREDLLQLFDTLGQGVVYQSNTGVITIANKSAEQIFGLPINEFIGRKLTDPIWKTIRVDGSFLLEVHHPAVLAQQTGEMVSDIVFAIQNQKTNQYCWVKTTAIPEFLPGQEEPFQVYTIFLNITPQKAIEHKLNERRKELQAFFILTKIVEMEKTSLDDLYQRLIEALPQSWQYPDITCGRIVINTKEFSTTNYKNTPWKQKATVRLNETPVGFIEISYLEERPTEQEGPFLREERQILDSIAERVGRITERSQTAENLQQKNDFLDLAIQTSKLGTYFQDFSTKEITLDEFARQHFGFDKNVIPAQDVLQRIHPDDRQRVLKHSQLVSDKADANPTMTEYRIIHPDGTIKWLAANSKVKYAHTDSGLIPISAVGTTQDITARKLAEENLLASEHRNKAIVDAIPDLLFRVKRDGTFLDYQAKSTDKLFAPPENFIGKKISDVLPQDIAQMSMDAIHRAFEQNTLQSYEYSLTLGNETSTFESRVVANLEADETVVIIRDVTEQRQMEIKIRKSEEKYRLLSEELEQRVKERTAEVQDLYDNAPTGYHSLDINGTFQMINETELKWLGYTREELIGKKKFLDIITPEGVQKFKANFPIFIKQGFINNLEFDCIRKDGSILPIIANATTIYDKNGNYLHSRSTIFDNTERKTMERELNNAKEAAESANKAKSAFLANMSHEIRTPMNAILGFTQIILKDQSLDDRNRNYLEIINNSGEHLLTLINEILEMSKIEAGHVAYNPTIFNLPRLIHDIESMLRPRLEAKNLTMTVELDSNLAEHIISDENKLKEILINLLGNAIKFTQQGSITLRCRTERDPRSSDPTYLLLYFDVEDTGIGIAPDDIPKLFKAFQQTRSGARMTGGTGTGLGLAISQSHARLMGGEITITSTPGVGSCFHVQLVVQKSEKVGGATDIPRKTVIGLKPETPEIKIMIVDDHEENRLVIKEILESAGIITQTAEDGKNAVVLAKTWKPDLIFMDLRMPVLDGFEAAKQIKATKLGKKIHIIAVTASILELDKYKVSESGMTGYIRKPFKDYDLFAMIENKLGQIFVYEDRIIEKQIQTQTDFIGLTPETITIIPQNLINQMRIATINAQFDKLLDLIDLAATHSPGIAKKIMKLAKDYQYDTLLKLFEER